MASTTAAFAQDRTDPAYQVYKILHVGFTALPIIAGLDKFFHILVNWECIWLRRLPAFRRYRRIR